MSGAGCELALGRASGGDDLDDTFGPVQEYAEWFEERFGARGCRELTGHDLGSAAGLAAYRAAGLKTSLCAPLLEECAGQVVRIAEPPPRRVTLGTGQPKFMSM